MSDLAGIYRFAGEYLALFRSPDAKGEHLAARFAERCTALGFPMDNGAAFLSMFSDGQPLVDTADFKAVAGKISDPTLLGSAIHSHFHHVMLWEGAGGLDRDAHRSWFSAALSRLAELTRSDDSTQIILFPAVKELRDEIRTLRTELSDLFAEQGHLLFQTIPNLNAAYQVAFGSLEYEIYNTECAVRRLRRKAELIRSRQNLGAAVDLERIEKQLDREFAEYTEILEEKLEMYSNGVKRHSAEWLSPEQSSRLRTLFRKAVKALHPDLHPEQTQMQQELFAQACTAYDAGDLETMESIFVLVEHDTSDDEVSESNSLARLHKERTRLLERIDEVRKTTDELKGQYPCSKENLLRDPEAKAAYIEELRIALQQMRDQEKYYKNELRELLRTVRQF